MSTRRHWVRDLKDDRLEAFVGLDRDPSNVGGATVTASLHVTGPTRQVWELVASFSQTFGRELPEATWKKPRYGRRRPRKPPNGQLELEAPSLTAG
jgi:hypothetical protein